MYTLIIGDKAYSSWSLRGWLLFSAFGVPFTEQLVRMYSAEFQAFRNDLQPAQQVPTLIWETEGVRRLVWDSLAIAELLAERHPDAGHWPADPVARAAARSLTAEMHSSFGALRAAMPMNLKARTPGHGRPPEVDADIERLAALWRWARSEFGGGRFLFGDQFTVADVFFTPVALRFEAYDVRVDEDVADYVAALQNAPTLDSWRQGAADQPWIEPRYHFD